MPDASVPSILNSLVSAVLGGVVVAILNYLFTRKKTEAEIKKLEAETDKIRVEINRVENISAAVSYKLAGTAERVIYDSTGRDVGYDFRGKEAQNWASIDGKDQPISPFGRGTLTAESGGVLNIQRTNTEGHYEVWLQRYLYEGAEKTSIPKDDLMAGQRSVRISCEAKTAGAEHTLRFVLKNEKTNKWLAHEERRITANSWTPLKIYFQTPPTEECRLRLDDLDVSMAPSSVQIRNFTLVEKMS